MNAPLPDDMYITVCDACFQASCWHGEFMCESARSAGTTVKTVGDLRALGIENPHHWELDPNAQNFRNAPKGKA